MIAERISERVQIGNRATALVVGPARSGTTLLHLLISFGFKGTTLMYPESDCGVLNARVSSSSPIRVFKHCRDSWSLEGILKEEPKLSVIHTVRDPRCLITSKNSCHGWGVWVQGPRDIERSVSHIRDPRVHVVRFEDLVADPNSVQQGISSRFGWMPDVPFSECYQLFGTVDDPEYRMYVDNLLGKPGDDHFRPISAENSGWGRERDRVLEVLRSPDGSILRKLVEDLGYDDPSDLDWAKIVAFRK